MIIRNGIGRRRRAHMVSVLPMAACVLVATPLMAQSLDQIGRWDPPPQSAGHTGGDYDWPLNAMHAVLLNDGTVLVWKYGNCGAPEPELEDDERLWNPATGDFTSVVSGENIDCAGHAGMADGSIFVPGGGCHPVYEDLVRRFTFGASGPWDSLQHMISKRWYPTATTLPDGRILVSGGVHKFENGGHVHREWPEIYDPDTDTWEGPPVLHEDRNIGQYPFMFVLPHDKVFFAGSLTGEPPGTTSTAILDLGTPSWMWEDVEDSAYGSKGGRRSAVMYEPGKVLVSGGNHGQQGESSRHTVTVDLTVASPSWDHNEFMDMKRRRSGHDLVLLPDGKILAVGGVDENVLNHDPPDVPEVKEAEWIDMSQAIPVWFELASMANPRPFHSVAILLPDGRVLAAGGDDGNLDFWEQNAEIFSPPYLFHNGDELAPRPVIGLAPSDTGYDETFRVSLISTSPVDVEDIARVTMVRPGAVTHGFDQNQRFIELDFTIDAANNRVDVTSPLDGGLAPPGDWMLFLISDTGVPSVGKFIRLRLP